MRVSRPIDEVSLHLPEEVTIEFNFEFLGRIFKPLLFVVSLLDFMSHLVDPASELNAILELVEEVKVYRQRR